MKLRHTLLALSVTATLGTLLGYTLRSAKADGAPNTLTYSGTLEDATGKPLSGTKQIGVSVWDSAMTGTGTKVCEASATGINVTNGRFDVALPQTCVDAVKVNPNLWIEVGVEGESLGRTRLGAVPYALEAAHAANTPVVTGWTAYAPLVRFQGSDTVLAGPVATGWWRRVGDSVEVTVDTSFASPPAGPGVLTWSLPPGIGADAAKASKYQTQLGSGRAQDLAAGAKPVWLGVTQADDRFYASLSGSETALSTGDVSAAGARVNFRATVPVAGWQVTTP